MAYQFPPDVEQLVREQMAGGRYECEDDLLRDALRTLREFANAADDAELEYQDAVSAVRDGVADMHAGRMTPLRQLLSKAIDKTPENLG